MLCLDLDIMEKNGRRMATEIAALGKQWRPHVKAHCQPRIAQLMMELGACGVTCATVDEVEVMAEAGIPSALLAHIAVTEFQRLRLANAARQLDLIVCVDHFVQAERYSQTAVQENICFRLLIDVDIGMGRTGTRPRIDAVQIAKAAAELPGITIAGIMGYEGHLLTIEDHVEKQAQIFEALNLLQATRDIFLENGLPCDIVSAGGSGSFWITGQHPVVTELQAGGGAFGDLFYRRLCGLKNVEPALTVKSRVVSRPSLTRAVVNSGRKSINPVICPPEVISVDGAEIVSMSAEHTVLELTGAARDLTIGDELVFAVGYSDHSILMHREIHVARNQSEAEIWPVRR